MTPLIEPAAVIAMLCLTTVAVVAIGAMVLGTPDRPLSQRWTGQQPSK